MPSVNVETAYFVNGELACIALIGQGIRMPPGRWIRIASGAVEPWLAQELAGELFPALRKPIAFAALLTQFDVAEFEAGRER